MRAYIARCRVYVDFDLYFSIHIHINAHTHSLCIYIYIFTVCTRMSLHCWPSHGMNGMYMSHLCGCIRLCTHTCALVYVCIYIYYPSAWTIEASFMQSLLRKHSAIACHCHSPPLRRPSIRMGRHQSEYCQCIRVLKLPYIYKHINSNVHVYRESS